MKKIRLTTLSAFASLLLFTACQRNADELPAVQKEKANSIITSETTSIITPANEIGQTANRAMTASAPGACNSNAYLVTLESRTQVGSNWEWVWSLQNTNPGSGNNGTIQDLSNWGMQLGTCVVWNHVVAAAYSNNGTDWTSFTPSNSIDPSQACLTTPVLKFDFGTIGSAKSYYRLTLSNNYTEDISFGYYKSGTRTGCCTFNFTGIGCDDDSGGPR
jgi:hypothetical protein